MNKIKANNPIVVKACDMRPGDIGQIIETEEYIIKNAFNHLISLSDGGYCGTDCSLAIYLLPPGSIITIEVNNA